MNQCPRCGHQTRNLTCCGETLRRRRWVLTKDRIRLLRVLAHSRKGLSKEDYRLRLGAVGVESTLDLDRERYVRFIVELRKLPDAPNWRRRALGRH